MKFRSILLGATVMLLLLGAVMAGAAVEHFGLTPRMLGPYIEKRTSGHNPNIVAIGRLAGSMLLELDRGPVEVPTVVPALGAQARAAGRDGETVVPVASADELRVAMVKAEPGSVITLFPGTYQFSGNALEANRPGRVGAPITVRAVRPESVRLEFAMVEGFRVSAPYWRFENLTIRGICKADDDCEHAFHVVGAAHHFEAVNNTISDFNAHFKINGERAAFPDDGLIASNTLDNTRARATTKPVTPIDLVTASRWIIRANLISDFIKAEGDRISYGAFAKGAGSANLFERNVVWCERRLKGLPGQRVGLSLGGGGTAKALCRDGKCITEQDGGILRANLIAGCSDVGIYLNSAAASKVEDNTLVDTAGVNVRFPTSSAQLDGNLIDGTIHSRNGGVLHLGDNRTALLWQSFVGWHPVRRLFIDPAAGDFSWRRSAPLRKQPSISATIGLCGITRRVNASYGAFDSFGDCLPASRN